MLAAMRRASSRASMISVDAKKAPAVDRGKNAARCRFWVAPTD
jgi:hypothetical protein